MKQTEMLQEIRSRRLEELYEGSNLRLTHVRFLSWLLSIGAPVAIKK